MAGPPPTQLLLAATLTPVLVAAAVTDLRTRTIPNSLTAAGAVSLLAVRALVAPSSLPAAVGWGAVLLAALGALAFLRTGGMGMGDAKLAGVLGLALGPGAVVALLVACAAATAVGAGVAVREGLARARRTTVPLAPFLAVGAAVAWALLRV